MAVPYNTSTLLFVRLPLDPDSFPEAMWVQMPDRPSKQPVLLPVVRMGCDTALVVDEGYSIKKLIALEEKYETEGRKVEGVVLRKKNARKKSK